MVGIICDLKYTRHPLFKSYYYAFESLLGELRLVTEIKDLNDLTLLIIPDDHWDVHRNVWKQEGFIDACNERNINVLVISNEKMLNSFFPWNEENLVLLNKFNNLYHYAGDVEDCISLGLPLCRTALSIRFKPTKEIPVKQDKLVFLGNTYCLLDSYRERKKLLWDLNGVIDIDIIPSNVPTWEEYMDILSQYRFVFSPMGNGNGFSMRFFEALAVGSIPVHQVGKNTLVFHDIEATFKDCIYFQNAEEVADKIKNCTLQRSYNEIWLEDFLRTLLTKDKLL